MLHKSKYTGKEMFEVVMDVIDKVDHVSQRSCPTLNKLIFKCPPHELLGLRRFLSLLFGLAIAFFLYWALVANLTMHSPYSFPALMAIICLLSVAFITSVPVRCILSLIVPTLAEGFMIVFFYALLFRHIFFGLLLKKLFNIVRKICQTLICYFSFQISFKLWVWREKMGPIGRNILSIVGNKKGELLSANMDGERSQMGAIKAQSAEALADFTGTCSGAVSNVNSQCTEALTESALGYMLPILKVPYAGKWIGKKICNMVLGGKIGDICEKMKRTFEMSINISNTNFDRLIGTDRRQEEIIEVKAPDVSYLNRGTNWDNFASLEEDLLGDFSSLEFVFLFGEWFFQCLMGIAFLCAFYYASRYHRKYLKLRVFANYYVDRYFRHIDRRRKAQGKMYLLPLRGGDREHLVPLFSPSLTPREVEDSLGSMPFIPAILLTEGLTVFLICILGDFLNGCANQLNFVVTATLNHSWKPSFTNSKGNPNIITNILNKFVSCFAIEPEVVHWEFDLARCAHYEHPLTYAELLSVLLDTVLLAIVAHLSIYFVRLRKIVCDYFYPRWAKTRTLYLYNDRLGQRKEYLKVRTEQLLEAVETTKILERNFDVCYTLVKREWDKTDPFLKRLALRLYDSRWFSPKCCFACKCKLTLPYFDCETPRCRLLYHEWCFADVGNRCLSCRARQGNERYAIWNH